MSMQFSIVSEGLQTEGQALIKVYFFHTGTSIKESNHFNYRISKI